MRSGSFVCLRFDCPKDVAPRHPCSRCEMPWVDKGTLAMIHLYQRCQSRSSLPDAGGVLDQNESVMRAFDVIDAVISQHRKKKMEDAQSVPMSPEILKKFAHAPR